MIVGDVPEEKDPSRFFKPEEEIEDAPALIVDAFNLVERNGLWYQKGKTISYTGSAYRLYPEGKKNWEINYKEGKRHGRHVIWDEKGKEIYEALYENGVKTK